MFCVKCGKQLDENSKFCIKCGAKINAESVETNTVEVKTKKKKPVIIVIGIILIIIGIVAASSGLNNMTDNTSTSGNVVTDTKKEEKITLEKFNKIKTGMTYQQVVDIIGEEGTVLSDSNIGNDEKYHTTIYYWYGKDRISNANVTIQGGKVISKAQIGLK